LYILYLNDAKLIYHYNQKQLPTEILITIFLITTEMIELTIVDYFIMGEAVGIVSTFIATLYYSRKQMQKISTDIESTILSDLADKMHHLTEIAIARPDLSEIFIRNESNSPKRACAHYTLSVYEHALHMYKRGILKDNAWNGWLRLIKGTFKEGTIGDYWKETEIGEWFDPDFRDFINNDIIGKESLT
jgi:hypothetical protein